MHQQDMVPAEWDDKRVLAQFQQQQSQEHQHDGQCKHQCEHAHNGRSPRRYLISAFALLFSLTTLSVLVLFFGDWSTGGWAKAGSEGAGSWFIKRATQAAGSAEDSPFIKNKLWLIVLIVGLFLVLIAGVMLSAWCCKGAFENPLCCPCYLCACCGGMACLECIGCGLCAGIGDDINV